MKENNDCARDAVFDAASRAAFVSKNRARKSQHFQELSNIDSSDKYIMIKLRVLKKEKANPVPEQGLLLKSAAIFLARNPQAERFQAIL